MAFDGSLALAQPALARAPAAPAWRRDERLVVLLGVLASGAMTGFAASMMLGRLEPWALAVIAAPAIAVAFYLAGRTLTEALARKAYGCAGASVLHVAALLAWPMAALFAPVSPLAFWLAAGVAACALVLFASCWTGADRAIYRMGAQGFIVAALAAHQGVFVLLG